MGQSNPQDLGNGGEIDGSLSVTGDLTVSGGIGLTLSEVIEGTSTIDVDSTTALVVRKNGAAGDVFKVDSTNAVTYIQDGIGTLPTLIAGNKFVIQNNNDTGDQARMALIAGATGYSVIDFGDASDVDAGGIVYQHHASADVMSFRVNASDVVHIKDSGVGIGDSTPTELLEIAGDSDPTIIIRTDTADQANSGKISFREAAGGSTGADLRYDGNANNFIIDTSDVSNALVIARTTGNATFAGDVTVSGGDMTLTGATTSIIGEQSAGANRGKIKFVTSSSDGDIVFETTTNGAGAITEAGRFTHEGHLTLAQNINLGDDKALTMGADSDAQLWNDGSNTYIRNNTSDQDIIFQVNDGGSAGTEVMRIDGATSNLGIGTNNPTHKLEVTVSDSGDPAVDIYNTHATNGYGLRISAGDDDNVYALRVGDKDGTDLMTVYGAGKTYIKGNTGIGEDSPDCRLHVKETLDVAYSVDNFTTDANALLKLENASTTDTAFSAIQFRTGDGCDMFIGSMNKSGASNDGSFIIANQNSTDIQFLVLDNNSRISLSNNDSGVSNTIFGKNAGDSDGAGDYNVFIGESAGGTGTQTDDADYNIGIGYHALNDLSNGESNVAIGGHALENNTSGGANVAIGSWDSSTYQAPLTTNTVGSFNIAIGSGVLRLANENDNDGSVGIGYGALNNQAGTGNARFFNATVAIGYKSLEAQTTGYYNTAIGYESLKANQTGAANTALGHQSLLATTGNNNTAVGFASLKTNAAGSRNTGLGQEALFTNATAHDNTSIGYQAGYTTTGADNVYVGAQAGKGAAGAEANNVGIGSNALKAVTTGTRNVAVGYGALDDLEANATTADGNVAIGYAAAGEIDTGSANIAIGTASLDAATGAVSNCTLVGTRTGAAISNTTANGTVAMGYYALTALTTGTKNIAIGYEAMNDMQTGTNNIALGYQAMDVLQGGDGSGGVAASANAGNHNIAIGTDAMGAVEGYRSTTEIDGNIAIGTNALLGGDLLNNNIDFVGNIAIGYNAVDATGNAQGMTGTIGIGYESLTALTSGANNVAVGFQSLHDVNTGGSNVALGNYAGDTITDGNENTCIGYAARTDDASATNQTVIGRATTGVADNSVTLGNASVTDVYMAQDSGATVHADYVLSQGKQSHVANTMSSPYYRFDGVNDIVDCGDVMPSGFGDSFSIDLWVYPEDVSARHEFIGQYQNSDNWWRFGIDGSDNWEIDVQDGGTRTVELNPDTTIVANKWQHVVLTRDGATWNFYLDGRLDATGSDSSTIPDIAGNVKIAEPVDTAFQGQIAGVKIWNTPLTATEVKELYSGASVPFKYKGANQTSLVTNGTFDSDVSGWTATNVTATHSSGAAVITDQETLNDEFQQSIGLTAGKAYRVTAEISGYSSGSSTISLRYDNTALTAGGASGDRVLGVVDSNKTITSIIYGTTGSEVLRFRCTSAGTATNYTIDNVSVVPIGAVAEYDGSGISSDKWFDKSGNDFHGTVSNGTTIHNKPSGDDGLVYEEGDWTPVLSDGSNNATSDGNTAGRYIRIGNQVTITGRLATSSLGSVSGAARITGLPYTSANGDKYKSSGNIGLGLNLNVTAGYNIDGYIGADVSYISLYINDAATGATTMTGAEWSSDGHAIITCTYFI